MKSLAGRFKDEGVTKNVLECAEKWGVFPAMTEFGVQDYGAMKRFLKEETGNENFGINPRFGGFGGKGDRDLFKVVRQKLEDKLAEIKRRDVWKDAELSRLQAENELLKKQFYEIYGQGLLEIIEAIG